MAVLLVPNAEVVGSPTGPFQLIPAPGVPLYQDMPRMGVNPILYETISPSMNITVKAVGGCPDPLMDLVTSITMLPGTGGTSGPGCNIISLVDIADRPVIDIPDFLMSAGFVEPNMQYGSIAGPPSPVMTLVAPLRGFYGEKYFYDTEYIYASYYKNTPVFDPVDGVAPISPNKENTLSLISLLRGKQTIPFSAIPPASEKIRAENFTGPSVPLALEKLAPLDPGEVLTVGSDYLQLIVPEVSSWVKWKPSFIEVMQYHYTVVVTHTCPPFVTMFYGTMLVTNNWTPTANRLTYYINLQNGFLDDGDP